MCIQVVERYAVCRCVYFRHSVDLCSGRSQHGHLVQEKTVPVGFCCAQHDANGRRDHSPGEPRFPERNVRTQEIEKSSSHGPIESVEARLEPQKLQQYGEPFPPEPDVHINANPLDDKKENTDHGSGVRRFGLDHSNGFTSRVVVLKNRSSMMQDYLEQQGHQTARPSDRQDSQPSVPNPTETFVRGSRRNRQILVCR